MLFNITTSSVYLIIRPCKIPLWDFITSIIYVYITVEYDHQKFWISSKRSNEIQEV